MGIDKQICEYECVNIIVPIYNGERFLKDTINSLLNQTYQNIRLILVDDGSTDKTYHICSEYEKMDGRVSCVKKENGGMSSGRDAGYLASDEGNWVLFFDADDIASPNMIERLMKYKEADMVMSCYDNIESDEILNSKFEENYNRLIRGEGKMFIDTLANPGGIAGVFGSLCGVLLNPSFFKDQYKMLSKDRKKFPQNYLNDAYSTPRLLLLAKDVVLVNDNVFHHRISNYSDSRKLKPNKLAYELVDVQMENIPLYKMYATKESFDVFYLGVMLSLLKVWYQACDYETDETLKNSQLKKIEETLQQNWSEFRKIKYSSLIRWLQKLTVSIYFVNANLWRKTVAYLRYERQY